MVPELRAAMWDAATIRTSDSVIEYHGKAVASIRYAFRDRASAAGL